MIKHEDQLYLFRLISTLLKKNIECYAFGGTAMMFYGYKGETKDIDLLFENSGDRDEFIRVIKLLGFNETSPIKVYLPEKLRDKNRPLMFKRDDIRFDLFLKKVIHTPLSPAIKNDKFAVHDFVGKCTMKINVMRKEHIVMLKSITERDNDLNDIITILKSDKNFNWDYLIEEIIWQFNQGNSWILLDAEKTFIELKKQVLIPENSLKKLYSNKEKKKVKK